MAFLFKRNPKTPGEVVRLLNEQVAKIDTTNDRRKDEAARYLKQMKLILHGDDETDPVPDQIAQLAQEIYQTDTLFVLVDHLGSLDFDSRKDVVTLFSSLLRRQIGSRAPTVDYLLSKPKILLLLLKGPENPEIGLVCGQILRHCIKFEGITRFVLQERCVWNCFQYCQLSTFELATDASNILYDLLTVHKKPASEFLTQNYQYVTLHLNRLIQLTNYVTKRQSVRLLSALILERQNHFFLNKYVDDPNNLKVVMLLLSDKSKNVQIEGFDIFKVFVAKPKKEKAILDVLIKNKENFIKFFENFVIERSSGNLTLIEERDYILSEIKNLPDIERRSSVPLVSQEADEQVYGTDP
ncbi:hypothetical protein BABINDRAFT_161897 [Babjeviella inositovora NRRL Y-12698]|uniref:Mo25-like protein n=1 Tax=Babjeviella inositovora NRRL Y-12698 TaxID=984486 RepID=A0A1E3QR10_9ASCO|nr:uncharacterized protein BABINDRAFT_161897 [Babjeviella inositovora NRRL Y-12698]ODQ79502.1 hypothetical protein BABINDRAFT_161897 [Babjeviella inositovora NRRL Y-12698]